MILKRKIFGFHIVFEIRLWSFTLHIFKINGNKVDIPLGISFGYGFLGNQLAKGMWFNFALLEKNKNDYDTFGIHKKWFVRRLLI